MGAVYEARHKGTGRLVAVKVITAAYLDRDDPRIKRFQREARAAGAIESQYIAQVLDLGEEPNTGAPYMVMEHLKGEDLQALIDRSGPLPSELALRIVGQACIGLQKAHNARVVHRDIKPANVFLARHDAGEVVVKLLDFGIAKIKVDQDKVTQTSGGLTSTGSILGSPLFMSPEQVRNAKETDHRTDIWSLGIVLYCALAGKPPFADVTSFVDLLMLMATEEPEPIQKVAPWVTPELAAVVHGAASLEPENRFPSAAAFLERIKQLAGSDLRITEEMLSALPNDARNSMHAFADTVGVPASTNPAGDPSAPSTGDFAPRPSGAPAARPSGAGGATGPQVVVHVQPSTQGENPRVSVVSMKSEPSVRTTGPVSLPDIGHDATMPVGSVPPRLSAPPTLPSQSRRPTALVAGGAAAVALLGVVLFFALRARGDAQPASEPLSVVDAAAAPTSRAAAQAGGPARGAEAPSDGKVRVRLVIVPSDAEAEVEGRPARTTDGILDLVGPLGSIQRVRIWKGKSEVTQDVVITEIGAVPPKLEIAAATGGRGTGPAKPKSKIPAEIMEDFK